MAMRSVCYQSKRIRVVPLLIMLLFGVFDLKVILKKRAEMREWRMLSAQRDTRAVGREKNAFLMCFTTRTIRVSRTVDYSVRFRRCH